MWPLRHSLLLPSSLLFAVLLAGCTSLPKAHPEWASRQNIETKYTSWAQVVEPLAIANPGSTGLKLLPYGFDAFAARLALADSAERTLDLQYYIWMPDDAGRLLAEHVLRAADRGVRVRLLLDDIGGTAKDEVLLTLSAHTNIEVRIFNPVKNRTFRKLSSLFDIKRVNHRMHNKSFSADRTVSIVGGRNIAEEYFGLGEHPFFVDFDVIAAGPVVKDIEMMFETFWYGASAIPIEALTGKHAAKASVETGRARLASDAAAITNTARFKGVFNDETALRLRRHDLVLTWARTHLVSDRPEKVSSARTDPSTHLLPQLSGLVKGTTRELLIISPYFVPGEKGLALFRSLRQRGVRVVVLSNSLASQDVTMVHAGYRRYRKRLLLAGVEMWEMRPDIAIRTTEQAKSNSNRSRAAGQSSLHMKTLVFDRDKLFVGSLNLTPRSSSLNTEMGLVMESPAVAMPVAESFEKRLPEYAYRVEFVPGPGPCKECGSLTWTGWEDGREVTYHHEPHASFGKHLNVLLFSLIPIESQL